MTQPSRRRVHWLELRPPLNVARDKAGWIRLQEASPRRLLVWKWCKFSEEKQRGVRRVKAPHTKPLFSFFCSPPLFSGGHQLTEHQKQANIQEHCMVAESYVRMFSTLFQLYSLRDLFSVFFFLESFFVLLRVGYRWYRKSVFRFLYAIKGIRAPSNRPFCWNFDI